MVFLNDGIGPQFERCNEPSNERRLRFHNKDTFVEAKEKLERFSEDVVFKNLFSSKLAEERFTAFATCAYPRKEEAQSKILSVHSSSAYTSAGQN